ncbi:MAG: SoxR reducing system RseC family protein [Prevotella sp.]|nr:SoxR reducing system RseC family protein [Prevotella sp.]
MSEKIKHSGIIDSLGRNLIRVRIGQSAACAGCKVSAHCNASETKDKIVEVYSEVADSYRVGESVTVSEGNRTGLKAALFAYAIPVLLMVAVLVVVVAVTGSESAAALSAILCLVPYYSVLFLFRNRISHQIKFDIEKIYN